jgi:signal transduction histidine kinase
MSSPHAIRPTHHPFPFLLYMEWALLGMAIVSELSPTLLPRYDDFAGGAVVCIFVFGGLGLWLPKRPTALAIAHVAAQLGLIFLAAWMGGGGLRLFPLLYLVLVIRSCLLFGLRGRLLVAAIVFLGFIGMVQARLRSLDDELNFRLGQRLLPQLVSVRLNLVVLFAILLVCLLLLMNALLSERERREELRQANEKLRASAAQIEKLAMAQERSRIAREIHDSLGHALTGLNIQLEGALKLWEGNPQQAKQFVAQAKEMGSLALRETRQAVATLRGAPLQRQDLATAIAPLLQQFEQTTGILPQVSLHCPPLPQSLQITVYRILQEALNNVCKYAQATDVALGVQRSPTDPTQLLIWVQDNGVGFHPQENTTGFGLQGMQERAVAEGGRLQLTSAPGAGCRIEVWLPIPEAGR